MYSHAAQLAPPTRMEQDKYVEGAGGKEERLFARGKSSPPGQIQIYCFFRHISYKVFAWVSEWTDTSNEVPTPVRSIYEYY